MSRFNWLYIPENQIRSEYEKIKADVLSDTGLGELLSINKPEDLMTAIEAFRKAESKGDAERYFKSEKHKLAFMILKHQGDIFDEELGIKRKHYIDKEAAKEWKRKYQAIYHPERNIGDETIDYAEVMQKINKIFNRMVGKA